MTRARQNTARQIADALLHPSQTLNPEDAARNAFLIIGVLKNSTNPDDWERVKRLHQMVLDYLGSCIALVMKDAGHPLDGAEDDAQGVAS